MTTTEAKPIPAIASTEKRTGVREQVRERMLKAPAAVRAAADQRYLDVAPLKPLAVSILQARALLSIGNSMAWRLIASGKLERLKIGSKSLVTYASIERFLEELRQAASSEVK